MGRELFAYVEPLALPGKVVRTYFTGTERCESMSMRRSENPGDRDAAANSDSDSCAQFRIESLVRVLEGADRAIENAGFLDLLQHVKMPHHRGAAKTVEVAVGIHDGVRDGTIKLVHLIAEVAQTQLGYDRFKILNAYDHAN